MDSDSASSVGCSFFRTLERDDGSVSEGSSRVSLLVSLSACTTVVMFELKDVMDQPVYLGKLRCVSVLLYEKYVTEASEALGME